MADYLIWAVIIGLIASAAIIGLIVLVVLLATRDKGDFSSSDNRVSFHFETDAERYGREGENYVSRYLTELVYSYKGYLFNGYCFMDDDGYSSEIDHIVVTKGGIFVIETKRINGIIHGDVNGDEWIAIKDYEISTKSFKNPVKQNQGHINHLRRVFGSNPPKMQSIVVFVEGNISDVKSDIVTDLNGALQIIRERTEQGKYSDAFVTNTMNRLKTITDRYGIGKEKHIQNIKKKHQA